MRFTIRDLLWLTVVVALGVCWWLDHKRMQDLMIVPHTVIYVQDPGQAMPESSSPAPKTPKD